MTLQFVVVAWLVGVVLPQIGQQPVPTTECPEYDRVTYSPPGRDWPGSIVVENRSAEPARVEQRGRLERSPHGTAAFILREPDTTQAGPWTTVIDVFGNQARPVHLRIRLTDHLSGGVRVRWLNEQLLWIQMWRGRVVSTDMILDVETARFVYERDADYNRLIVPCSMKAGVSK
jgi:hypothetical protein